jgi:hypothetical protein
LAGRSREGLNTVWEADRSFSVSTPLMLVGMTISSAYVMTELGHLKLMPFSGPRTHIRDVNHDDDYEDGG